MFEDLSARVKLDEGAVQSTLPVAQATKPEAGRTEGDTAGGSSGAIAVVERTSGRSPSALILGCSRSPGQGELPLQWMDPRDPTSTLFSLDNAAESIEWGSLDEGISAMMDVLNQARGVLCDIIIPNGRVFT